MTISDKNVIDGMGIDQQTGDVVLAISDHLGWEDDAHTRLIEQKLGSYIHFVRSGQILRQMPAATGRAVRIELICQHSPPTLAEEFLLAVKRQLKDDEDLGFDYRTLPECP